MKCFTPLRIKNPYTGKFLHVPCRTCEACVVSSANIKAVELMTTLNQYRYVYMTTLTYDNDFLPYVLPGSDCVFRGQSDCIEIIGDIEDDINWSNLNSVAPTNHDVVGAIGVLWYDDVQRFFKRYRKYINKNYGKREFKYFCLGEYGSHFHRPHYHIIIFSNDLVFEEARTAAFENWKKHDWNRFFKNGVQQGFKACDAKTAYYCASYVSGNLSNVPISRYKQFREKTCRSKNIYYGLDASLFTTFKEDISRIVTRDFSPGKQPPLWYWDKSTKNSVSIRLLSKNYVDTYFSKFKGFGEMAFSDKLQRAYYIVECCSKLGKYGISKTSDYARLRLGLSSADLSFYRCFKRFMRDFGFYSPVGISNFQVYNDMLSRHDFDFVGDYLIIMQRVLDYFESQILKCQMMQYTDLGHNNYVLSLIDTCIENPSKRQMDLKYKYRVSIAGLHKINLDCPPFHECDLNNYVYKYKKRLLPKHFNDKSNLLNFGV